LSAIGHRVVFRLARWSWQIRTGFLGPRATWDPLQAAVRIPVTGLTPSPARHSNLFTYAPAPALAVRQNGCGRSRNPGHATPAGYHTWTGLAFVRVRSPLLTESLLFSLPAGTEMFHFPAFPPHTLCVQAAVTAHDMRRGFPIRTSWDHGPVIDSPRLIADSHVLHRLPVPRHPPCALINLSKPGPGTKMPAPCQRCSRPLCSSQTTTPYPPHAPHPPQGEGHRAHRQEPGHRNNAIPRHRPRPKAEKTAPGNGPVASGPNSVPWTGPEPARTLSSRENPAYSPPPRRQAPAANPLIFHP
jgi:hypothetical protein